MGVICIQFMDSSDGIYIYIYMCVSSLGTSCKHGVSVTKLPAEFSGFIRASHVLAAACFLHPAACTSYDYSILTKAAQRQV